MTQLNNPYASFSTVAAQAATVELCRFHQAHVHSPGGRGLRAVAALEFAIFQLLPAQPTWSRRLLSVQL